MADRAMQGQDGRVISRRKWLQSVGVGTALGLAGCTSGDNDNTETPTDGNGNQGTTASDQNTAAETDQEWEFVDKPFVARGFTDPSTWHFNPYNAQARLDPEVWWLQWDVLAKYNIYTRNYVPMIASEWSHNGDTFTVTLSDRKWHNGDSITTDDVITKFQLQQELPGSGISYLESVTATDDQTVEFQATGPVNSNVIFYDILETRIDSPKRLYGEILTDIQNASSDDERNEIVGRLRTEMRIEEPHGNGPFKFSERSAQRYTMERFDEYPEAEANNYPRYEWVPLASNNSAWQAYRNKEIDGMGSFVSPEVIETFPEGATEILEPMGADYCLIFQWDHEFYGKPEVRQAFAHILNIEDVATNIGPRTRIPVPKITGIPEKDKERYLGDLYSDFSEYNSQSQAEQLLRDAGLEKESGTWVKPDGDPLSAPVLVPAPFSDWVSGTQTLVSQLQEFGIQSEMLTNEYATYSSTINNGDFNVAAASWGSAYSPYPYVGWLVDLIGVGPKQQFNMPMEQEVAPVGDPEGAKETINLEDKMTQLASTTDSDEAQTLIQELCWFYNQNIPKLQIADRLNQMWIHDDGWEFPPVEPMSDKHGITYSHWRLTKTGNLHAEM